MDVPHRSGHGLPWRFLGDFLVAILLACFVLEGGSRLVHWGVRPMLPNVTDASGASLMPGGLDIVVSFSGGGTFEFCSDRDGLRIACGVPVSPPLPRVLAVGDSQTLGWGLNHEQAYGTLVGKAIGFSASQTRAMAVASSDVETMLPWARDYQNGAHSRPELKLIAINLGNDLDEMFFSRSSSHLPRFKRASEWLAIHSYFVLDFQVVKEALAPSRPLFPPGTNPVLFSLDGAERMELVQAIVASVDKITKALPVSAHTVIVLIPSDYQVAAAEFTKYEKFYPSSAQYVRWAERVAPAAAMLDEIEQGLGIRLRSHGFLVSTPRTALQAHPPVEVFDRSSHHLTALGHRIVADSIVETLQERL